MKRLFGLTILSAGFRLVSLIITVALLAGCQASAAATAPVSTQPPTFEELVHQFDYDPQVALAVIEKGMVEQDGIKVHDLSYVVPSGERVEAYLVMPPGSGPFPGIISLGSQGEDRSQFLGQAKILAKTGIASLIITASFDPIGKERDHDQFIQAIIKLRRAVDLLAARPEVDPKRLGFIGFGDSADMGAVLAGVEKRLKAYVLMAGGARVSVLTSKFAPEQSRQKYMALMGSIDPIHYIGHAAPAALFFQNGSHGTIVPEQEARDLQQAGSEPKQIKWYDAYDVLPGEAYTDASAWLLQQLSGD